MLAALAAGPAAFPFERTAVPLDGFEKAAVSAAAANTSHWSREVGDNTKRRSDVRRSVLQHLGMGGRGLTPEDSSYVDASVDRACRPFDRSSHAAVVNGYRVDVVGWLDPAQPGFVQWRVAEQDPNVRALYNAPAYRPPVTTYYGAGSAYCQDGTCYRRR